MTWKIPLYKIYNDAADIEGVKRVISRGENWTNGPEVLELEKALASQSGTGYALAFNNGTSALQALMLAYEIKQGDEVIVPSFTFISTANSVLFTGAKPVFADIENKTFALNPADVRKKITPKTKAIMPIHYAGCPASKIEELAELAEENDLLLIEDAAESQGAKFKGKMVGTFGDAAMLSFCANKIITCGEGGAVLTDSKDTYEKLKLARSHGRLETENYFDSNKVMDYVTIGYNLRLGSVLAALALSQLKKINMLIEKRRAIAKIYDEAFKPLGIKVPADDKDIFNVYQMYTIQLKNNQEREKVKSGLDAQGIMSKIYFPQVLDTHFYKKVLAYNTHLPVTERVSSEVLTLPLYPTMTPAEIQMVCDGVKSSLKGG